MAFWSSQLLFGFIMFSHIGAGIGIYDISHEIDLVDKYEFLKNPGLIIGGILGIIVMAPTYFLMYWGRDWRKIFEHMKEVDSNPILGGIMVIIYIVFSLIFFFYVATIKFK